MKLIGNVFLVRGTAANVPDILDILAEHGFDIEGNPDIDVRTYSQFLVDDARLLVERALSKSVTDNRRVFIIATANLTSDAQNTMLKTLEEPAGDSLFFFLVPAPEMLLATVRSRAQILSLGREAAHGVLDAGIFLKTPLQARLDMLKPLLEKDEDDARDISSLVAFLSSLERTLAKRVPLPRDGIEAVYRARKYAGDKGSLLKVLLEQVALLVPVTK